MGILLTVLLLFPALAAAEPLLLVTDPAVLSSAESQGLRLSQTAFSLPNTAASNAELMKSPGYAGIVAVLEGDLAEFKAGDPRLGVGMKRVHRLFDAGWLKAGNARFELIAIANRLDRKPFRAGTCGETRLVYRLAYSGETASRLPMTVNAVFWAPEGAGGCKAAAKRWQAPKNLSGEALARWLRAEGPLTPELLSRERLKSVEVNLQSVRWPSTIRPDMAGHAEYVLRVFQRDGDGFTPGALENTPDVERLREEPALKAELLSWLKASFAGIEDGTAVMPDKFAARRALSFSPHGLARSANRPFSRLFAAADFGAEDFSKGRQVRNAPMLLRRLDTLSCSGCHQARSVAGFHLIGEEKPGAFPANAIAVPFSPHVRGELARRKRYLAAVSEGRAPDETRPLAERADSGDDGYGAHCGLGRGPFKHWTCAEGLRCRPDASGDGMVGICLPSEKSVGDPCETGAMRPAEDRHKDAVTNLRRESCGAGYCESNEVGFPNGMCARSCDGLGPEGTCGAIAILSSFNACLAKRKPFTDCLNHVRPAGLRACDAERPCRDDYICARTAGDGNACIPPYFLFQMRVDGHPEKR